MLKLLKKIPASVFETTGTVCGLTTSLVICSQILQEAGHDESSTLSLWFILGFLTIFLFWTLYGLRFDRLALWLTNAIAGGVQIVLLITVLNKV